MQTIHTLSIDHKIYSFAESGTILQICELAGKSIPRFCYHSKLSIAANCRMCLIQLGNSNKPVAACAVPAVSNLEVFTNTTIVKKARESVIEFLLINHPLDCPICDQGGECDLQDQTLVFGSDRGRYYEFKRAVSDLQIGVVVKTFMTRCIHCTRCVRFLQEISSSNELGLLGRGQNVRISTFINEVLNNEFSGNIADLCPVGALTIKPYAFSFRSWEVESFSHIDLFDSIGTSVRVDVRGTEIIRVLPIVSSRSKNFFITDKTRFFFESLKYQRILTPLVLNTDAQLFAFASFSWNQFKHLLNIISLKHIAFIIGNMAGGSIVSTNTNFLFKIATFTEFDNVVPIKLLSMFYNNNTLKHITIFSRRDYTVSLDFLEQNYNFFLFNFNPFFEVPSFGLHLVKKFNEFQKSFFVIGPKINSTIPFCTIGVSSRTFVKLSYNKISNLCTDNSLVFGSAMYKRLDAVSLKTTTMFYTPDSFKIFTVLHKISEINAAELGLTLPIHDEN